MQRNPEQLRTDPGAGAASMPRYPWILTEPSLPSHARLVLQSQPVDAVTTGLASGAFS